MRKKLILFLASLILISFSSEVLAADINRKLGYSTPSLIREDYSNKKIKGKRLSYPVKEKTEPSKKSTSSVGVFYVGYVVPVKSSSKAKYRSKAEFKKIKKEVTFSKALKTMESEYQKLMKDKKKTKAAGMCIWNPSKKIIAMKIGKVYATSSGVTMGIGKSYITRGHELWYYGAKGYTPTQSKVYVGISGLKAYVSSSSLTLVPKSMYDGMYKSASSSTKKYNLGYYYKDSAGNLMHRYYTLSNPERTEFFEGGEQATTSYVFTVDRAPAFMKKGVRYYSMDGYNYYTTATLTKKAGTYYPYFRYLPYRTQSSYTKTQFNNHLKTYSKKSVLRGTGAYLVSAQNTYGINALLELSFADIESAYGTSYFARNRYNLFGIAAADSSPNSASKFKSAGACITRHAGRYLSQGYFDTKTDSRYFGTCPGNKKIGVNVKYASDPYHGEKIGGIAYVQDKQMGSKDYGKYTIGMTKKASYVYKSASTKSKKLLRLGTMGSSSPAGMTVAVLGEKDKFYKVQTDMGIVKGKASYKNKYNFKDSVGYVLKSEVTIISDDRSKFFVNGKTTYSVTSAKPSSSAGFTPGYSNTLRVTASFKNSIKSNVYYLYIYDSKGRPCSRVKCNRSVVGSFTHTFEWNGKTTKNNLAKMPALKYVKRSASGTKYTYRVVCFNGKKKNSTKAYAIKVYSDCTDLHSAISKLSVKQKQKITLSMKPNRPGTSMVRIYNSKDVLVYQKTFQDQKKDAALSAVFDTKANTGSKKGKLLPKGKYTAKFTLGNYTYKYPEKIVIK